MLSKEFTAEMKQELLNHKAKLEAELKELFPHTELGDDLDSQAQEVEDDAVNRDVIATIKTDLEKVKAALLKVENGTYGVDAEGKEISEARLRVIPWADKAI